MYQLALSGAKGLLNHAHFKDGNGLQVQRSYRMSISIRTTSKLVLKIADIVCFVRCKVF